METEGNPEKRQALSVVIVPVTDKTLEDGKIGVLNQCHKGGPEGEISSAKGKAWVVDKESNAKLKVSFFWPFAGDYWIIDLAADYSYAVIGDPDREYLWILARTPTLPPATLDDILGRVKAYEAIVKVAEQKGCDLIMMASHGRKGIQALLLGSETQKVLTHSKIPVLVYR